MQFALVKGIKAVAQRDLIGVCAVCGEKMIPKCGFINLHHWAHASRAECDPWWEPESEWHRSWKEGVSADRVEVTLENHRADIITSDGVVVELQHSSISVEEIAERERFYQRMIWLFDGRGLTDKRLLLRPKRPPVCTFRWKHPRKHYRACQKPVFIDLGGGRLLWLLKIYLDEAPYGGWGELLIRL